MKDWAKKKLNKIIDDAGDKEIGLALLADLVDDFLINYNGKNQLEDTLNKEEINEQKI